MVKNEDKGARPAGCAMDYQSRITIEPVKRGGKPTIRSLRIYHVLRLLAEASCRYQ